MISARERTLNYVVLVVFAVYALYPLVMIVDLAVSPDLSGDAAGGLANFEGAWEQGRFIRFHGLARWVGWLWPYLAMVWLLLNLGGRQRSHS